MSDPPTTPAIAKPQRFHGFDALRGGAMLLGIVLHAAITYMHRRMDGLLWPLNDQPTSYGFDVLFWWIHGWRIPLFFVMAGFFAAMLARRRGPGGFLRHRALRILLPVTIATVTLLPAMYFIWGWGWQLEGRATFQEVWRVSFDDQQIDQQFLGPAHLWFLNYLVLFSLIYWAVLKLRGARATTSPADGEPVVRGPLRGLFISPLRPLLFAGPTFAFLAVDPGFYLAYHHVLPETATQWGYESAQVCFQGYFFLVGVYLFRLHREMAALSRHGGIYLIAATALFVGMMFFIRQAFDQIDRGVPVDLYTRLNLAAFGSLFCWTMVWGMTAVGLTVLAKPRAWARWLSDSAYWVYLVHLPIVAVLLIVMRYWPIGPWPRFVLIVAITSALTLASYQWGVRYTWVGRLLNGPRVRADDGQAGRARHATDTPSQS